MPPRRDADASATDRAAPFGRAVRADQLAKNVFPTRSKAGPRGPGSGRARWAAKAAATAMVLAGLLLLAPWLVGRGVRPQLTGTPLPSPTTAPPVGWSGVPPLGTMLPAPPETSAPPAGRRFPRVGAGVERLLLALVNTARAQYGCPAVRLDRRLSAAAAGHTEDMAGHDLFSHTGSNGSTPLDRAEALGDFRAISENIARGYATPQAVMAGWLASPPHRANILSCSARVMGAAYLPAGQWWTEMFGE